MNEISNLDLSKLPKRLNNSGAVSIAFNVTGGTNYTAPSNGVFIVQIQAITSALTVGGVSFNTVSNGQGGGICCIPCQAGATITANKVSGKATFIPEVQ